jgi:hypothetical protein
MSSCVDPDAKATDPRWDSFLKFITDRGRNFYQLEPFIPISMLTTSESDTERQKKKREKNWFKRCENLKQILDNMNPEWLTFHSKVYGESTLASALCDIVRILKEQQSRVHQFPLTLKTYTAMYPDMPYVSTYTDPYTGVVYCEPHPDVEKDDYYE